MGVKYFLWVCPNKEYTLDAQKRCCQAKRLAFWLAFERKPTTVVAVGPLKHIRELSASRVGSYPQTLGVMAVPICLGLLHLIQLPKGPRNKRISPFGVISKNGPT